VPYWHAFYTPRRFTGWLVGIPRLLGRPNSIYSVWRTCIYRASRYFCEDYVNENARFLIVVSEKRQVMLNGY